ncbi:MAG: serine hydrolase, partial [Planctomycetota bacterium]
MGDTFYLIFLFVGLFSILLGALAALVPRKLTAWEQRLWRKLRLTSESKMTGRPPADKFVLERLLGCVLLAFGIVVIYHLPIRLSARLGDAVGFTLSLGKSADMADSEQPVPLSDDSFPAKGLHIVSAKYGASNTWRDVSKQLREKICDNSLSIVASNDIAGDPLFGVVKSLRVDYVLDGERRTAQAQEGQWLHIPPDVERHPELRTADTQEELLALVKQCPAQVGFFGKNLKTGATVEYRPDQPACLASIVKIFVLLEVMRQADEELLDLSESITISREDTKETCTITEALDKMIGISDNEATTALAKRAGWDRVNALPAELGITGLSDKILPEPGILGKVLDKRVYGKARLCA